MKLSALAIPVSLLVLGAAPALAADAVGKAASVRREAKGTPPDQAERELSGGLELYSKERVVTSETGDVQVVFLDESTLSIGPGSDLVLDEFVYDPKASEKALGVKLRRGATRLIGGRITKGAGASIETPNATIAIRGGIVVVKVGTVEGGEGEETRGLLGLGVMTCTLGDEEAVVTVPGTICILRDDIEVRRATKEEIAQILAALAGSGASDPPSSATQVDLKLDCGGEASLNDPRCVATAGFAGVDPEPLGAPRDANLRAQQTDQFQEVPGTVPSNTLDRDRVGGICCDEK